MSDNELQLNKDLNIVPFVSVDHMMKIVGRLGMENMLEGMAAYIEEDFKRWELFDKTPRVAAHSDEGVIELMPTSDGEHYGFKYVNGHPKNMKEGLQTVTAFGVLSKVYTGYPILFSEMTILTALRTAATSVVAARYLARKNSRCMALIGNGAQSEFQALAFKTMLGIDQLRLYDIDPVATEKFIGNMQGYGFEIVTCNSAREAAKGADIITTATADKQNATILTDDMVEAGVHINAVGGDCPGKTELEKALVLRSSLFVEYPPQTRIEGELQQLDADYPVNEMWRVIRGELVGRKNDEEVTLFDSVGFATEDFSALRYIRDMLDRPGMTGMYENLDMIADPDEPRDLFGMVRRSGAMSKVAA
ncbi:MULTISPECIES: ornithine cyclodeaminase [unclassified Cocleimonas]|uniref:ornithine cyclodeaminase n=1 Tax=unclassified Cocleimonas TaxID=2639732 RepID=UPI002607F089|nr:MULTISPECIES: ornithine cyclodeaminase [unclassified Cocleimonas]MEB8431186.1 ornithine cyclodeaminase [Cocleimonas sp. KMM 6892]MEC4714042.1 ornithine cyclodeaminase [Cocleimonas sp. KMM 6895]MEC4743373.1 ornithine cyclodeaminase [Cocleimonas sp. KMM 6896]